jgi:hypothetical protein
MRRRPPREGAALLQGLAICGKCGQRISVRYTTRNGWTAAAYVCVRARTCIGEPACHHVVGRVVDAAISKLVTDVFTPAALGMAIEVQQEIHARVDDADRLRAKAVERAQYEADAARRRFMRVDPDNRLVADTLEGDWNTKLRALASVREEYERQCARDRLVLDASARQRVLALATDFPRLWSDPATPQRERKRMLALILEDVTLLNVGPNIVAHVRFRGGRTESLTFPRPKASWEVTTTDPEVIAEIDRLLDEHIPEQVSKTLNERGFRPGRAARDENAAFTPETVLRLVTDYKLRSRADRLRARGYLTGDEMTALLGISHSSLRNWARGGRVIEHACDGRSVMYEPPSPPRSGPSRPAPTSPIAAPEALFHSAPEV